MNMAIDAKKIVDKVTRVGTRKGYQLSLDEGVMEAFKAECDRLGVKYSPIIEELLKEFLESSKSKKLK